MVVSAALIDEMPFTAAGQGWRLRFGVNAMCRLERLVDEQSEVVALLSGAPTRMCTVRAAMRAGLLDHHPHLTDEDVGDIIDHLGATQAGSLLYQALVLAFGGGGKAGKSDPPKATREAIN